MSSRMSSSSSSSRWRRSNKRPPDGSAFVLFWLFVYAQPAKTLNLMEQAASEVRGQGSVLCALFGRDTRWVYKVPRI